MYDWIDITRWIGILVSAGVIVSNIIKLINNRNKNPQDHIMQRLLIMEMWMCVIFVQLFMHKIMVVLAL